MEQKLMARLDAMNAQLNTRLHFIESKLDNLTEWLRAANVGALAHPGGPMPPLPFGAGPESLFGQQMAQLAAAEGRGGPLTMAVIHGCEGFPGLMSKEESLQMAEHIK